LHIGFEMVCMIDEKSSEAIHSAWAVVVESIDIDIFDEHEAMHYILN
jgi:hypothetical protein